MDACGCTACVNERCAGHVEEVKDEEEEEEEEEKKKNNKNIVDCKGRAYVHC
jgi:hypothetical protein